MKTFATFFKTSGIPKDQLGTKTISQWQQLQTCVYSQTSSSASFTYGCINVEKLSRNKPETYFLYLCDGANDVREKSSHKEAREIILVSSTDF